MSHDSKHDLSDADKALSKWRTSETPMHGQYVVTVHFPCDRYSTSKRIEFGTDDMAKGLAEYLLAHLKSHGVSCYMTTPRPVITLDYNQITDVEVDGIDHRDAPDFVDAFIASATYCGREMTEDELEVLNEDSGYVYDAVQKHLY